MDQFLIAQLVDIIAEDIANLPNLPTQAQIDKIIWNLFEVMMKLSEGVPDTKPESSKTAIFNLYKAMLKIMAFESGKIR